MCAVAQLSQEYTTSVYDEVNRFSFDSIEYKKKETYHFRIREIEEVYGTEYGELYEGSDADSLLIGLEILDKENLRSSMSKNNGFGHSFFNLSEYNEAGYLTKHTFIDRDCNSCLILYEDATKLVRLETLYTYKDGRIDSKFVLKIKPIIKKRISKSKRKIKGFDTTFQSKSLYNHSGYIIQQEKELPLINVKYKEGYSSTTVERIGERILNFSQTYSLILPVYKSIGNYRGYNKSKDSTTVSKHVHSFDYTDSQVIETCVVDSIFNGSYIYSYNHFDSLKSITYSSESGELFEIKRYFYDSLNRPLEIRHLYLKRLCKLSPLLLPVCSMGQNQEATENIKYYYTDSTYSISDGNTQKVFNKNGILLRNHWYTFHYNRNNQIVKGDKIYYDLKFSNIYNNKQKTKNFVVRDDTSKILDRQSNYKLAIQSFRLDMIIPLFLMPIKEGFVDTNITIN